MVQKIRLKFVFKPFVTSESDRRLKPFSLDFSDITLKCSTSIDEQHNE